MLVAEAAAPVQASPARNVHPQAKTSTTAQPGEEPIFEASDPGTDVTHARDPQLLNQTEMLSLVKDYATQIAEALIDGERRREETIRQKDAIKLACIQDRLSAMKLMKKLSDDSLDATARPTIRADELHFRHEFRGVEMVHQRVLQLQRELIECVGENLELGEGGQATQPSTGGNGGIDPGGTNVEVPPVDRPVPASSYK